MKINRNYSLTTKIVIALSLVVFAVASRLLPHPANFAPIAAIAIFGGAVLPRKWALTLPLGAMIVSDLVIGLHPLVLFTWGSFILIALISNRTIKVIRPTNVVLNSLLASILFYVITNFGVWLQNQMYPMTSTGLISCYINALPFFRNTLLGDLVYTTMLFGIFVAVTRLANVAKHQKSTNSLLG